MPSDQTRYDIFISYARRDNEPPSDSSTGARGWVTALRDYILADHRRLSTEPLRIFLDASEIRDMDDWRHRILGALRSSKILLVCLSPAYFASQYCRWEWQEYVTRQVHQLMGSDSIAGVYFVDVPGSVEPDNAAEFARWVQDIKPLFEDVSRANYTDIRPWFLEGAEALQRDEVRRRMDSLGISLWERLQRARRATVAPGNLRRQNPHFVGRREELLRLHQQLATGAVGVVTAVHGLGGQGKTELAVAYAHSWADRYPAGLWLLGAEGKKELLPAIGELAWDAAFGFTPSDAQKKDPVLLGRGVLAHLQRRAAAVTDRAPDSDAAALLVLDNVSEQVLLSPAQLATLPRTDWLRILATTRLHVTPLKDNLVTLAVDALDEDTALRLLREHQPPRDAHDNVATDLASGIPTFVSTREEEAARQIVRELGGFTLAVEQVAVYLGLHPEIAPSAFLAELRAKGLPSADAIPARDPAVAERILTQNKQLAVILETTLAGLDAPSRTTLEFAARLPPDLVPWPWLKTLATGHHPALAWFAPDEADPWLTTRRRLEGFRFLTPGDNPELGRIHRLVAAHIGNRRLDGRTERASALDLSDGTLRQEIERLLTLRASAIYDAALAPREWEMDALLATVPRALAGSNPQNHELAIQAVFAAVRIRSRRTVVATDLLARAAHGVLESDAATDPTNPTWQHHLSVSHEKMGDVLKLQGKLAGALASYRASLTIDEKLSATDPDNTDWLRALSISHNKVGDVLVEKGDLGGALASYRAGLAIRDRLCATNPSNVIWQRDVAVSHERIGHVLEHQGNLVGALSAYQAGLSIDEKLAATDSANATWQDDLSVSHERLGDLLMARGNLVGAAASYRASFVIAERLAAVDPADLHRQHRLSIIQGRIATILKAQGNLPEAFAACQASLTIGERLAMIDPANATWEYYLSISQIQLCRVLRAQGSLAEALAACQASLSIRKRLTGADPENATWQRGLAICRNELGDVLQSQGDLAGALVAYQSSLAIDERLGAADLANATWQRGLAISLQRIGEVNYRLGNIAAAERAFRESLHLFQALSAADPTNITLAVDVAEAFELLAKSQDSRSAEGGAERRALLTRGVEIKRQLEARVELDREQIDQLADLEASFQRVRSES